MRRSAGGSLALLALLAACSRPAPAPEAATEQRPVCRVGPDGGPVADKGIGGTGAPLLADKGIGGTGGTALADRGIGGTGIVAVITGFASICLAGQEVALPADTPIVLGDRPAAADALRAGQVAIVEAGQTGQGLSARRVVVRFEVSGPVDAVTGDRIRVAGQDVALSPRTEGPRPTVGDWVAVSGLRRGDGTIEATRLTPRAPGPVELHGTLRHEDGTYRIGRQALTPTPALPTLVDRNVVVTGPLLLGQVQTESAAADLLVSDPASFFGPSVGTVLFEGFGEVGGDRLRLAPGFAVPVAGRITSGRLGVYRLERGPGGLRAVGGPGDRMSVAPGGVMERPRDFTPAPMPNRRAGGEGGVVAAGRPDGFSPGAGPRGGPAGAGPPPMGPRQSR